MPTAPINTLTRLNPCSLTALLLLSASSTKCLHPSPCFRVCLGNPTALTRTPLRFTLPAPRTQGAAVIQVLLPFHLTFSLELSALLLLLLRNLVQSPSLPASHILTQHTSCCLFYNINTLLKEHLNLQFNTYSISICSSTVSQSSLCQAQGRLEMNSCCLYPGAGE